MPSLPTARPRTYTEGDPLVPEDMNEVFDAIKGGKHGVIPLKFSSSCWKQGGVPGTPHLSPGAEAQWQDASTPLVACELAGLRTGMRIKEIRIWLKPNVSTVLRATFNEYDLIAGLNGVNIHVDTTNNLGDWEIATLSGLDIPILAGMTYQLYGEKQSGAGTNVGISFGLVEMDVYIP